MTLHLLLVEDDNDFVDALRRIVEELPGETELRAVGSRQGAYEALSSFVDLIILDLKIPTVEGALDADPRHGSAVFNKIRTAAPGTPVLVLTGSPGEVFLANQGMDSQQQVDVWGEGEERGTIRFVRKDNIGQCRELLCAVASAVEGLSSVELAGGGIELTVAEDRLLRIFARKVRGRRCAVSELRGGLSDARVLRLAVTDEQGAPLHDAVAKLSSHEEVRSEADCYDVEVVRLAPAATPRKLGLLEYGAHRLAGVFFGLADGSEGSAFQVAGKSPERASEIVASLEESMQKWTEGVPERRRTIRSVRRPLLGDELFREVQESLDLAWVEEFERRRIQVRVGCSHGDLHGENVLVASSGAQLIDYAEVGPGPASLDPVTLELSVLFHPRGPGYGGAWPSGDHAKAWGSLEQYLEECPFPKFVKECRAWALRSAAGWREVAACAYAYLVKQLKYPEADRRRACALLEGVKRFYEEST